ncbi:alkylation response protein AidB-like acyl-CoA dehydrogenase [Dongia mobilis]|uniref:Medium-chain specific acyl-CoA dehydrogenase, mitochondrial n=1 Tax=Dongia mobilis TaxID=578943 RepID=A0A4R6WQ69_9PROT|nr:acyl-CoA dehydrogenase family protein [Dongia mobilis]TDQ80667.1 alkylation response protein AidB-like acyl-CoA dehydrogenase [Dongia mobilis]
MDLELSTREKELAAKGRAFCDEVLLPLELITDEHGELPMEKRAAVRQAVRDWGLAGINHAKEHGGLGLSMVEQTAIEEQLGRVTNGLWSCVWRAPVSLKSGSPAQIDQYLRPSIQGERRGCFAITEAEAGSDPRRVKTKAIRKNGQWLLSGEKWFVTSYNASDFIIVHAHVDDDPDKPTLFLVDKPVANMVHLRSPKFMHNFAFDHAELRFEETPVPEDRMLGQVGQGLELTKDWFVEARMQIASHTLGAAIRAAEIANDYATTRHQFERPIRDFQGVEFMLADMAVEIFAAKSMLYRVAAEIDRGLDRKVVHAHASALKLFCSEVAGRVIDRALQVLGGRGYMRENPVERLYRDIRVDRIWEGTSEIQRVVVGGQIRKRGLDIYSGWQ